jgi:hypothetical protein
MGDEQAARVTEVAIYPSATWVTDVAREVTRELAPQELPVFDAVAAQWAAEGGSARRRGRRPPGAAVGFGIDGVLLSEVVFPVLTGAISDVVGEVTWEGIRERRRSRRERTAPATDQQADAPAAGRGPESMPVAGPQLAEVHAAFLRHAITLGQSPDAALLMADAMMGALARITAGTRA